MATRQELIEAVRQRYQMATRADKQKILDEFVQVTSYHRKHAVRVLREYPRQEPAAIPTDRRLYGEAVRQCLVLLWEAADRICGKRLKAVLPTLIEAMERCGHLPLDAEVRRQVLAMSASTIDRVLQPIREPAQQGRRRSTRNNTVLRQSIPVRTCADWHDPVPGFLEVDFVVHAGGSLAGSPVHTLVLTDVASGWTECLALPVRAQSLVVDAVTPVQRQLPFALRGLDTDNDSAFINDIVLAYCRQHPLVFTRSRAYRKNDQAWVEQKNGAVVRRLVGYDRLTGMTATQALAELYAASRLYVNFFQPSFKLKGKQRYGAKVVKQYHAPATPYERLLTSPTLTAVQQETLRAQFLRLDPVRLLAQIRRQQQVLHSLSTQAEPDTTTNRERDVAAFVASLSTAWRDGEVRPTHRCQPQPPRHWRTRVDPFAAVWPQIEASLHTQPEKTAQDLFLQLQQEHPGGFPSGQLRTLQRRVKQWRSAVARQLVLGVSEPVREQAATSLSATTTVR